MPLTHRSIVAQYAHLFPLLCKATEAFLSVCVIRAELERRSEWGDMELGTKIPPLQLASTVETQTEIDKPAISQSQIQPWAISLCKVGGYGISLPMAPVKLCVSVRQ